jgi:hypothetical protein
MQLSAKFMLGFTCAVCGRHHDELPLCFLTLAPVYADTIAEAERAERVALSSDQCVIDERHFFILGNLDLPIIGRQEHFRWSLWSSLSKMNFERASDLWEKAGRESEPPYFGWLSATVPGYETTVNLKVAVQTQPLGVRPLIQVQEQEHPLYRDQVDGISWERACELSHAATAAQSAAR